MAEIAWIKSVQRLIEGKSKELNNTLGLYLNENGVILCKGRLKNSELTPSQVNPNPNLSLSDVSRTTEAHYKLRLTIANTNTVINRNIEAHNKRRLTIVNTNKNVFDTFPVLQPSVGRFNNINIDQLIFSLIYRYLLQPAMVVL